MICLMVSLVGQKCESATLRNPEPLVWISYHMMNDTLTAAADYPT